MIFNKKKDFLKISVVVFVTIAYFYSFYFLYNLSGKQVAIIVVLPVMVIGLYYGFRLGIIAGLLALPINVGMYTLLGEGSFFDVLTNYTVGSFFGWFGIILIGGTVGRISELRQRIQLSLRNQKNAEAALRKSQETLEIKVQERTAELTMTNKALQEQIEERKKTEQELAKLATAINQANEVVIIISVDGAITYTNPAFESQMGYSFSELIDTKITSFDLSAAQNSLSQKIWRHINKGNNWAGHMTPTSKDGSTYEYDVRISPIRDSSEEITSFVCIAHNVTKEIKLEEQLRRSEKMETIGTLAGGVAHDLNNILGAIVGYPELMLDDIPKDSPLRSSILAIKKSGERAVSVIQDLLTLARRGVVISEVENLNSIITEYLDAPEFHKLEEFHPDVSIETNLATALLNILGSHVHLIKVVMNLVSNAAEAMPTGGKIIVSTENTYLDKVVKGYDRIEEGDYVLLTVSDEGIGISGEDLKRIFEPFYTKKEMGRSGTGLGMAVVWGTVKDHRGYIDIESKKGTGTVFKIYFPVTRKETKDKDGLVPIEDYGGNGEKILIIDDIKAQREIASHMLTKLNYKTKAVKSGEEAVEYLKNNSADILILDMIMDPGIDGLETYKRILEIYPNQKAIIASGFSETGRVKEVEILGAGGYIGKPFLLEKIGLAVKEELEK